jgi:hypothetical protein
VEESAVIKNKPAGTDLKALLDLLQNKGAISRDEADGVLLRSAVRPAPEKPAAVVAAPADKVAETPDQVVLLPEKELRPVVEILREQGALGVDEAAQISERIGRKWNAADEEEHIAATGQEIEYNRTTLPKEVILGNIVKLRHQGLVNEEESNRIRQRFLQKYAMERVTDSIGDTMKRDVQTQVAEKIIPVPEWTKRITLGGDLRLRYQGDFYDNGNGIFVKPDKTTEVLNSNVDRTQFRVRARLNVTAKVNDDLVAGLGLATGNTTNPVSTNATLGDTLNKKNIVLDQAYLKWTPIKDLTLLGGRFANPWFNSDLVWDPDVNFDGFAISYKPQITSDLSLFLTGGAFPIQEVEFTSHDKWLYAGQVGLKYRNEENLTAKLAAAIYSFDNTTGKANLPTTPGANDWSSPQFQQKGNTLFDIDPSSVIKTAYAAGYQELNLIGSLDIGLWDSLRVLLLADYVNNFGYKRASVNANTGFDVKKETEGYQFGMTVGYPETRELGQWKLLMNYKYLEADAVMDAFVESDFHLGGTNAKGWIFGGDLGLGRNFWLSSRWYTANQISGLPFAVDVFQFNVNAKF